MQEKEIREEEQWLNRVYREIDKQLAETMADTESHRQEMQKIRRTLWEDLQLSGVTTQRIFDVGQQISELEQTSVGFGIQHAQQLQLQKLEKSPYFGRMDFQEEGSSQVEPIYIGIGSLLEQKTKLPMIYDWRAPICSMFYDYGLGLAEYQAVGGAYQGEILLKRQYRIAHRKLAYMFDNALKIDDEVLQEALSRHATDTMRNIVNSIQREQNKAIRNEGDELLLVEGPAGSGKTSVALHRIAYLLYKYRDSISSENIVIFSPNKIFSNYISHVLPELGEENVHQTTFQDYAERFLGWEWDVESLTDFLEETLNQSEKRASKSMTEPVVFKFSDEMQGVLERLIEHIRSVVVSHISHIHFGGKLVISKEQQEKLFEENYQFLPIARRLEKLGRRIKNYWRAAKKQEIVKVLAQVQQLSEFEYESRWTVAREAISRVLAEYRPLWQQIAAKLDVDVIEWYKRLWTDDDLWKSVAGTVPKPAHGGETIAKMEGGLISFADTPALLFLKGELEGYPTRRGIRHVIIDEVQDYSPLQLSVIAKLFPKAKITMVGDINQSMNPFMWQKASKKMASVFDELQMGIVPLTKSYRSTYQISRFCQGILGEQVAPDTVVRDGEEPTVVKVGLDKWGQKLISTIQEMQDAGYQSIALICLTAQECRGVFEEISGRLANISLLTKEKDSRLDQIAVLPVYLAKGLEFDAVIVPDASEQVYHQDYHRKLLYVACSRALHRLSLIHTGKLSPFVPLEGSTKEKQYSAKGI